MQIFLFQQKCQQRSAPLSFRKKFTEMCDLCTFLQYNQQKIQAGAQYFFYQKLSPVKKKRSSVSMHRTVAIPQMEGGLEL